MSEILGKKISRRINDTHFFNSLKYVPEYDITGIFATKFIPLQTSKQF